MKKLYTILFLTLTVSFAHAQWAGFNDNGTDNLWSNDANWAFPTGVTTLDANWDIDVYQGPTTANLDEDYTAKRFRMPGNKAESFTLTGENTLTIDIASTTQANENSGALAIWSESTVVTTLTFDCDVTIANSLTPDPFKGVSVFSTATAGSIIEFAAGRTLNIGGTSTTSFWGLGEVHVNGDVTGSQGIILGNDTAVNFGGPTTDFSGYTGAVTLATNSDLTLNSNGTSTISNIKIQCNAGGSSTVTLESENVITPTEIRASNKSGQVGRELTMNINANQTFNNIKMKAEDTVLNLNIDPAVTSVAFGANNISAANWVATSMVNIIGYQDGVVKFGTDDTSLNNGALLANILIDGAAPSEPLALDANGDLVYQSTLSVKDNTAFEFSVYPNPAKNEINIATQVQLQNAKVYNIIGKTVLNVDQPLNRINVSNLNTGIYILTLTSNEGAVVNKKIIID